MPSGGQSHTAQTPDDLPETARREYDSTPPPLPLADAKAEAYDLLDTMHADFLRTATGDATIEERDTWKPKEEAARALIDGNATNPQRSMIETEAAGDSTDPSVFAQVVVGKADAFHALIGAAGGIRRKAQAGIEAATDVAGVDAAMAVAKAAIQGALSASQ